jgi:hypothetical protein
MATTMYKQAPDPGGSVIKWPPGSRSVIQDYSSADSDPIWIRKKYLPYGSTKLLETQYNASCFYKFRVKVYVLCLDSNYKDPAKIPFAIQKTFYFFVN